MRHRLRREVPGTLGLLADEEDFAAMRRYPSFAFDDHRTYLRQVEGLLRASRSQGLHTSIALFDPEEYALYCAEAGLEPDAPASRAAFTASLAADGATVPYDGRPLDEIVPDLVDEATRRATWEFASVLLADIGECAECGQDIGRAVYERAAHLLARMLGTAGPGEHRLVCSAPVEDDQLLAALGGTCGEHGEITLDEGEAMEFATVLAVALASKGTGAVVLRTTRPGAPDRVRGWAARGTRLVPLSASEVFDAYCHDLETGDLTGPESGVEYCAGPELHDPSDEEDFHH